MRVYTNLRPVRGPYGGAYNFMGALMRRLAARGFNFHNDPDAPADVALLNALNDGLLPEHARRLFDRGVPIVHRKVGYIVSGSPEMRAIVDGRVFGDAVQMKFDPYVKTTIFQSAYSANAYAAQGYSGKSTIIRNGADETIFNHQRFSWLGLRRMERAPWRSGVLRLAISTWSMDPNKGFDDYLKIDAELDRMPDVEISLAGRVPAHVKFKHIQTIGALKAHPLAEFLKTCHGVLMLSRLETCSNALIEAMNCGLPAIYLDSGSNGELAGQYGTIWDGDLHASIERFKNGYSEWYRRLPDNPFRLSLVAPQYEEILRAAAET
jgi:glycosyltransferase involved in cell wall biosynthesis